MKVALYSRTSTIKQNINEQLLSLVKICDDNNWDISGSFKDCSTSGLISDLNTQVDVGNQGPVGFTDINFNLKESDPQGTIVTNYFELVNELALFAKMLKELSVGDSYESNLFDLDCNKNKVKLNLKRQNV